MNPYSCEQIVIVSLFMCLHAWVDWSVWAFVTPHVWSVSVWLISWFGSFSPIFPASPEMLLSPPTCPEVSGVWGHSLPANQLVNSCQSHNSAPRLSLPFLLSLAFEGPPFVSAFYVLWLLLFFNFMAISSHNQFAQHAHYLLLFASVAIVLEFNNHFHSFLLGNWGSGVCECVFLFSRVDSVSHFSLRIVRVCGHNGETVHSLSTVANGTPH